MPAPPYRLRRGAAISATLAASDPIRRVLRELQSQASYGGGPFQARKYGFKYSFSAFRINCLLYTKAGVFALTKLLGKELAIEGICVNAVSPAVVHTQILDQLTPEQVAYMTDRIPMRRVGRAEEIAYVVHFLSCRECSFVTAQCYGVSGGRATY